MIVIFSNFRLNTTNHGAYCLNETIHIMASSEAYDEGNLGKNAKEFPWGCLGGDPNAL